MAQVKYCPACGKMLQPDAAYCYICGKKQMMPAIEELKADQSETALLKQDEGRQECAVAAEAPLKDAVPEVEPISVPEKPKVSEKHRTILPFKPVIVVDQPEESPFADSGPKPEETESLKPFVDEKPEEEPVEETNHGTEQISSEVTEKVSTGEHTAREIQEIKNEKPVFVPPYFPDAAIVTGAKTTVPDGKAQEPKVTVIDSQDKEEKKAKKRFPWFFTASWSLLLIGAGVWGYFLFFDYNYDYPIISEDVQRVVLYTVAVALLIYTLSLKLTLRRLKFLPALFLVLSFLVVFYFFCTIELIEGDTLHDLVVSWRNAFLTLFN